MSAPDDLTDATNPVHTVSTGRLEAFSDGVLAIAITLLILDVKVPLAQEGDLGRDLARQWPSYATFAVSFLIIGIMWVNHHYLFAQVGRVTRPLLFLNIGLLMTISFLPFPTALLAEYLREDQNSHIAAAVYSITMTVIGLAFVSLWTYLSQHPELLADHSSPELVRYARSRSAIGPVVYGATIALAFLSAPACLATYVVMGVYFMVWRGRPKATESP